MIRQIEAICVRCVCSANFQASYLIRSAFSLLAGVHRTPFKATYACPTLVLSALLSSKLDEHSKRTVVLAVLWFFYGSGICVRGRSPNPMHRVMSQLDLLPAAAWRRIVRFICVPVGIDAGVGTAAWFEEYRAQRRSLAPVRFLRGAGPPASCRQTPAWLCGSA